MKVQWMEKPVEVKRTDKVTKVKITVKVRTEDGETGEAGEEDRERQDFSTKVVFYPQMMLATVCKAVEINIIWRCRSPRVMHCA